MRFRRIYIFGRDAGNRRVIWDLASYRTISLTSCAERPIHLRWHSAKSGASRFSDANGHVRRPIERLASFRRVALASCAQPTSDYGAPEERPIHLIRRWDGAKAS